MCRLIAHRGFAARYPENTLPAVRQAAAEADAVEVDVRRAADGTPVVIHDATVDRVTDASGAVASFTPAELAELDVLGSGAGVPRLSAVVGALPADVDLILDLKEQGVAADALAVAEEPLVSAFDADVLREARRADPAVALAALAGEEESVAAAVGTARELDCVALHPHQSLALDGAIGAAHEARLTVNAWTVRDPAVAAALRDAGVDGVIADWPV
jgi:glycerophosphoryl diester phosphodiesterase